MLTATASPDRESMRPFIIMDRENPRITTAAAAAIAVFAVSGPVGPFGATAYGQQLTDKTGAPERVGTNQDNSAVQERKPLFIPELMERVQEQGSHHIRLDIEWHVNSHRVDARDTNGEVTDP